MKKILVLHWWEWNSKENWFPWLQKELEEKFEIIIPDLSKTNYPVIAEQLENLKDIKLNSWDYIIWHSLWAKLAIQFLEEQKIKDINVILVAPTYPNFTDEYWAEKLQDAYEYLYNYNNEEINFRKINLLNNKYTVITSDNDPFINSYSVKEYYSKLKNTNFIEFKWKWHFNEAMWITQFPEILEFIK